MSVPAFVLVFSCAVSVSSSPQFFGSVFLFGTLVSFQFLCVFLCSSPALSRLRLPHIFFGPPPGSFLCLGVPRLRCFHLRLCGCPRYFSVFAFTTGSGVVWLCLPSLFRVSFRSWLWCGVVPFELSFPSAFISPSSPFPQGFWLRLRFLFLYPSIPFPLDFLLAFSLLPAPSWVLWPPGLVSIRLWVCVFGSSVASLFPLPLWFRLKACYPSFVGCFLPCFASSSS